MLEANFPGFLDHLVAPLAPLSPLVDNGTTSAGSAYMVT